MSLRLSLTASELRTAIGQCLTPGDLARLLEISPGQLNYFAYGRGHRYRHFQVRKRRGGKREIAEPLGDLKIIQQKLLQVLTAIYDPPASVHGFLHARSIATNAAAHATSKWVLNVDLTEFFASVNFGRVRGVLMAPPYAIEHRVATVIAQLACYKKRLPQGAPTSPILANMVAANLDFRLQRLARRYQCVYTRYADDITLSSNRGKFPPALAEADPDSDRKGALLGPLLSDAIAAAGFTVNADKTRLMPYYWRQEVTGLTVNEMPNVRRRYTRQIRAMLHSWRTHGVEGALERFVEYDTKDRGGPRRRGLEFPRIVKGKIDFLGMVRGLDFPWYDRFLQEFAALPGAYPVRPVERRRRNHIPKFDDAIWVIETEFADQSTAFELAGIGLVTCAHSIIGETSDGKPRLARAVYVYHPRALERKVPAAVLRYSAKYDIAILRLAEPSGAFLEASRRQPTTGTEVYLAGYPGYDGRSAVTKDHGVITGIRDLAGVPRITVSMNIIAGASGSPVYDRGARALGVASWGKKTYRDAAENTDLQYGVIPISVVLGIADGSIPSAAA